MNSMTTPINLGALAPFAVLGGSTVTSTGATVLKKDPADEPIFDCNR
jgi:hypothetical protein